MSVPPAVPRHALGELRYSDRVAKLGRALIALSRDLASCRREVADLERENAELRRRVRGHGR